MSMRIYVVLSNLKKSIFTQKYEIKWKANIINGKPDE